MFRPNGNLDQLYSAHTLSDATHPLAVSDRVPVSVHPLPFLPEHTLRTPADKTTVERPHREHAVIDVAGFVAPITCADFLRENFQAMRDMSFGTEGSNLK